MRHLLYFICFALLAAPASAITMVEKEKINGLLALFDKPGIAFSTDGEAHDGAWAKQHLEFRYKTAIPAISTAREFIETIGAVSPSGNRNTLKLPGGQLADAGEWLTEKLKATEIAAATPATPKGVTLEAE